MQQGANTRLRHDPTDYARKQQVAKERAKELRDQRQKGTLSDDHTFAPKINPKGRNVPSSSGHEEQPDSARTSSTNNFDDIPIRPSKNLQQGSSRKDLLANPEETPLRGATNLSKTKMSNNYNNNDDVPLNQGPSGSSKSNRTKEVPHLEPEHDSVQRDAKRSTGYDIDDIPIKKPSAPVNRQPHTGPCTRNSSCTCRQCSGGFDAPAPARAAPEPSRKRDTRVDSREDRPIASQSEIESSLSLLKSKMSRRKSRSAPSNPENLFVDDAPVSNRQQQQRAPAPRHSEPSRSRAPAPPKQTRYHDEDQDEEEDQGYYQPTRAVAAGTGVAAAQAARRGSQSQQRTIPPAPTPAPAPAPTRTRNAPPPASSHQDFDDRPIQSSQPQKFTQYSEPTQDAYDDGEASSDMYQCENCTRKFNPTAFSKHQKICEKVFSGPKKVFNMAAKRLEGTGADQIAKKKSHEEKKTVGSRGSTRNSNNTEEQIIKAKKEDWKKKSEQFRQAMQASREVSQALKEGRAPPPMAPSAPDPSLILCDYCGRRFNDKAAERHINFCREKSQRDNISKGPPKKTASVPSMTKTLPRTNSTVKSRK